MWTRVLPAVTLVFACAAAPVAAQSDRYDDRYDNRYDDRYTRYDDRYDRDRDRDRYDYAYCDNCGRVEAIREVDERGRAKGGGAAIGAIAGGLIGNQIGSGSGRRAATVAGAIAGGVAGNEMERRRRGDTAYELHIRMDDGERIVVVQPDLEGIRIDDRVRIDEGRVERVS